MTYQIEAKAICGLLVILCCATSITTQANSETITYACVKASGGKKPAILHISDDHMELAKDPNRGVSFAEGSGVLRWTQKSEKSGYWSTVKTWNTDLTDATKANIFGYSSYIWHVEREQLIFAWGTLGLRGHALFGFTDEFSYLYDCSPL